MKAGFVAIIGRPNVGKSALLNKIIDFKLSIVSSKPQTTRDKIKGIYNDENSQIIFLDTPGIHKPQQKVGEFYNESSFSSLKDSDLILFLTPIDEEIGPGDRKIIDMIPYKKRVALISKLDKGNPDIANKKAQELKSLGFNDILGVSKNINHSIKLLINYIKENLPTGSPFYDNDNLTDKSTSFFVKEFIRETAIELTHDEIPHSLGIKIDSFAEGEIDKISATIFVERESQKGMLIGKNGSMIKKIGIYSRKKIEELTQTKCHLMLKIKVAKNWTKDLKMINKMGY